MIEQTHVVESIVLEIDNGSNNSPISRVTCVVGDGTEMDINHMMSEYFSDRSYHRLYLRLLTKMHTLDPNLTTSFTRVIDGAPQPIVEFELSHQAGDAMIQMAFVRIPVNTEEEFIKCIFLTSSHINLLSNCDHYLDQSLEPSTFYNQT